MRLASPDYRGDIDGLRAVAVLLVVAGHAGIWPFAGGFVGVDVFFVISGFLITRMIVEEVVEREFSLARFYTRRAKRILPALLLVIVATLIVGFAILLPNDFARLGWSGLYAALGASNFYFSEAAGYFSNSAATMPLLHTWSLGVEEQFYLLWPVVAWGAHRLAGRHALTAILASLCILSLLAGTYSALRGLSAQYFLPWGRAWELGLGGLLAIYRPYAPLSRGPVLSFIGIVLIIGSALALSPQTPMPGLALLPACLGTMFLIAGRGIVNRLLAMRPLVAVGLVSYSLYLWHWPVLVFFRYAKNSDLSPLETIAAVILSGLLAFLSYRFVEQPARRLAIAPRKTLLIAVAAIMAVVALTLAAAQKIVVPYVAPEIAAFLDDVGRHNPRRAECFGQDGVFIPVQDACIFGEGANDVALWGDSHSLALAHGLEVELTKLGRSFGYYGASGCRPVVTDSTSACANFNREVLAHLVADAAIRVVVMAARWTKGEEDASTIEATIRALINAGKSVVLVYSVPEPGFGPAGRAIAMLRSGLNPDGLTIARDNPPDDQKAARDRLDAIGDMPGLSRVDPADAWCGPELCEVIRDGRSLYIDPQHLSMRGSEIVAPVIVKAILAANN